ncbi:prepilin peptidase [Cellulosimicrobium protaetiae]|uniref:Prepilin peptidase n=1 Tax=Cellulosimicrobium protaetiae TaxID=2587808 RepID=A0A6M5UNJ3_9MICO|nr:A24 family peptidase [Cellulosimicrobium protaetiae]QJW38781.1 prepilin peptidase [Cellulosimicrobium protaetiae]
MNPSWALAAAGLGAGAGVALWWRLRTGSYRRRDDVPRIALGWSWLVIAMAAAGAAAASTLGLPLAVPAGIYLVVASALVWIDVDVHRVPDAVLAVLAPVLAVAVLAAAAATGQWSLLGWALAGAAGLGVVFLVLALVGSMGFGDVKLAATTGIVVGPLGVDALFTTVLAGFLVAVIVGVAMLVRGAARRTHLAFGPAIIAGALIATSLAGLGF